jgi:8-oxo-dGTP diphosphatase
VLLLASFVALIDWQEWAPTERAVLCFVRRDGELLLIRKKRGLGAGKVNGPGGRIEDGESAEQAAVRETFEEVGVRPLRVSEAGELAFVRLVEGGGDRPHFPGELVQLLDGVRAAASRR